MDKVSRTRALNDAFRRSFAGGRVMMSAGVAALPNADQAAVLAKVQAFDGFDRGNDPHGEHDFVSVEHDGVRYFGKIDYYDPELRYGSDDPADPARTARVLTVTRADEY